MSGPSPRHNSDGRRDRQLGIITQNKQRFEAFRADDALESVRRQVCPFCGEGPFLVVARHVYLMHGITSRELRNMLGILANESICDPTHAQAVAARSVVAKDPELRRRSLEARRSRTSAGWKMTKAARLAMSERRKGRRPRGGDLVPEIVCPVDGTRFTSPRHGARYCSRQCAALARAAERAEREPLPRVSPPIRKRPKKARPPVPHSSDYPGVGWDASRMKWRAFVRVDGRSRTIGRFDTEAAALQARLRWLDTADPKTATAPPTGAGGALSLGGSDHSAKPHTNEGDTQ